MILCNILTQVNSHSKTHCTSYESASICLRQIHEISRRCETANLCGRQTSQYYMIDLLRYASFSVFLPFYISCPTPESDIVFTRGSRTLPRCARSGPVRSGRPASLARNLASVIPRLAAAQEHVYRLTSRPLQRAILTVTNSTTGTEACINESFQFNSQH